MHNFRKLDIWIDGIELADSTYLLTDSFPKNEVYGFSSQMQRAAVSVPSNIAEGAGKDSIIQFYQSWRVYKKEYIIFMKK